MKQTAFQTAFGSVKRILIANIANIIRSNTPLIGHRVQSITVVSCAVADLLNRRTVGFQDDGSQVVLEKMFVTDVGLHEINSIHTFRREGAIGIKILFLP